MSDNFVVTFVLSGVSYREACDFAAKGDATARARQTRRVPGLSSVRVARLADVAHLPTLGG